MSSSPALTLAATSRTSSLETLYKGGAVIFALTYGAGFLIVSLHHATFGISQFNPLKPRIFSAGILFLFLVAISASFTTRFKYLSRVRSLKGEPRLKITVELIFILLQFLIVCSFLAFSSIYFLVSISKSGWEWALGLALFVFSVASIYAMRSKKIERPLSCSILGVLAFICLNMATILFTDTPHAALTYWYLFVGITTVYIEDSIRFPSGEIVGWERLVLTACGWVGIFATLVYGNVSRSWGGGESAPVSIHFSKPTPLFSGNAVNALLVEETEEGFYLIDRPESKNAVFVPRSSIAGVRFGRP